MYVTHIYIPLFLPLSFPPPTGGVLVAISKEVCGPDQRGGSSRSGIAVAAAVDTYS
jgi:hypothetical protein